MKYLSKTATKLTNSYKKHFVADLFAGITVALILIPQSMAYAQLAGLPAYYGLYASLIPPLIAALFGSSNHLSTGPVAIVSLLTASSLEPLATSGSAGYIEYAILLAFTLGLVQLLMGVLKFGFFVHFISHPVIFGFTNAAAIIIATSQFSKLFGVTVETGAHHYETVIHVLREAISHTHLSTFLIGIFSIAALLFMKRISKKLPGILIVVVVTTLISWQINYAEQTIIPIKSIDSSEIKTTIQYYNQLRTEEHLLQVELDSYGDPYDQHLAKDESLLKDFEISQLQINVEQNQKTQDIVVDQLKSYRLERNEENVFVEIENSNALEKVWNLEIPKGEFSLNAIVLSNGGVIVGEVPSGLPIPQVPAFDFSIILMLLPQVLVIALIGFTEAISVAQAISIKSKQKIDVNKELIGQGMSNLLGSIFMSYPVAGSFSRTAVNYESGAKTKLASVITSGVVGVTLLFFTGLLYYLPASVLSAIIFVAVISLMDLKKFRQLWILNRGDAFAAIVTFVVTLYVAPHMEYGLIAGVIFAVTYYMYKNSYPRIAHLSKSKDGSFHDTKRFHLEECTNIAVIRFDAPLFFANANILEHDVLDSLSNKTKLQNVLIVGTGINEIDVTGQDILHELALMLKERKKGLYFASLKAPILDIFKESGLYDELGDGHFFSTVKEAVDYLASHTKHHKDEHHCPLLKYQELKEEHVEKVTFSKHVHQYFEMVFRR